MMFASLRAAWAANKVSIIAGLVVLAVLAFTIWLMNHDAAVIESDRIRSDNDLLRNQAAAGEAAGAEHIRDERRIANQSEAYHDAINAAAPSAPSPAAMALNCQRLRRAGQDVSRVPACAGR